MATTDAYPRDMIGYAGTPPHPRWPGNARLAVNFVLNYEEGSETSVLHGDGRNESGLSEVVGGRLLRPRDQDRLDDAHLAVRVRVTPEAEGCVTPCTASRTDRPPCHFQPWDGFDGI